MSLYGFEDQTLKRGIDTFWWKYQGVAANAEGNARRTLACTTFVLLFLLGDLILPVPLAALKAPYFYSHFCHYNSVLSSDTSLVPLPAVIFNINHLFLPSIPTR